jgi:regulator of ribosome biosynthesis
LQPVKLRVPILNFLETSTLDFSRARLDQYPISQFGFTSNKMADTVMMESSVSVQIPVSELSISAPSKSERLPTTVEKPTPYTYDLGYLTATDPNPLPSTSQLLAQTLEKRNEILQTTARDGAQSLLNTLLTTCPINSTPDGLLMSLPQPVAYLPRWKPLPKPKQPTKWEQFARKKGIGKFGGSLKGGAAQEDRRKNLVYDEESGEWVKKWGYKGANKKEEGQWLVELDDEKVRREKEGADSGKNVRMEGRRERKERIKRQERRQRGNERRMRKGGG